MTTYHSEGNKSLIQAFHCSGEVHANQFNFMLYQIKYAMTVFFLQKSSGFYPMSYLQIPSAITLLLIVKLQIR